MNIRRLVTCLAGSLCILSSAFSQSVEKITFDSRDSVNGYYLAVKPRSGQIKGTLIMMTSFGSAEDVLPETRLHNVAYGNDMLIVYLSMGMKLYADAAAIARINAVAGDVVKRYAVDSHRIALAGYNVSGGIALRYTELANQYPAAYPLHPRASFAVDSPVDVSELWHWCERLIKKNYYPAAVGDGHTLLNIMRGENGELKDHPEVYARLSAFNRSDTSAGNEQYLQHTPVRLYFDTDIEWQLVNRRNSLYDTHIPEATEMISRLLLAGNDQAEFVSAKRPGIRSNGMRHPATLSIVDEVDCIHWLKNALDIFDPLTWKPPYTLQAPKGWDTERFPLPAEFAKGLSFKGIEDIRFHPDWANSKGDGYWSYAFVWWLDETTVDESVLANNFRLYYDGLIGQNIGPRHIPAEKLTPVKAVVKRLPVMKGDKATYSATIHMLDYMSQQPMVLHGKVHVIGSGVEGKTAVFIQLSPKEEGHAVWQQMDALRPVFPTLEQSL